jgi:transposase
LRLLRKANIQYEMSDDDAAHLCHDLGITVQAARGLLVNQNCDAVRALIEQRGAHLSTRQRAERDAGKRVDGPPSAEREELGCLRRENHRLHQERDILAKAAAWFARESKASPNGFTGS